jgi:hypothetical protein
MSKRQTESPSSTASRTAFRTMESLEQRVLFDTTIDTGYGWKITYPDGVQMNQSDFTMLPGGHLRVRETINDTRSNKPLYFQRTTPWGSNPVAQFFALDISAHNNTGGPSNKVQLMLVDFGDFKAGPDSNHPRWAHFHVNPGRTFTHFSTVTPSSPFPGGPMQVVELSSGEVPAGQTLQLGGGENGFRMHFGTSYPSTSFSLFQALYWETKADRLEANDTPGTATNLGTVSYREERELTLHLKHGSKDVDYYKFTPSITGLATIDLSFINAQGNIDLAVLDGSQNVLKSSATSGDYEVVNLDVQAGNTYYVKVSAANGSSSQRKYDLTISNSRAPLPPEINLFKFDGTQIPFVSTEVFDLGSVVQNSSGGGAMQFVVKNDGEANLSLGLGAVPDGFVVEGLKTSLACGDSDVFTVRIDSSKSPATRSGRLIITNNDPDEGAPVHPGFGLNLKGTVTPVYQPKPEINLFRMDGSQIPFVSTQVFDLGSVMQSATSGGSMEFKIRNDGDAVLSLSLKATPEGFVVTGLASSINPGQQSVFTVRIDSSKSSGTRTGRLVIANNDPDESNPGFGLNLKGKIEALPPPKATIRGRVFNDQNADGRNNAGDRAAGGVTVFLDDDGDGSLDAGETSTRTDSSGNYSFEDLDEGSYRVAVARRTGWRSTSPSARLVELNESQNRSGLDFGMTQRAKVGGRLFNDRNGNGKRDGKEKYLAGWRIFFDADRDGKLDAGEQVVTTNSKGSWAFNALPAGKRQLRVLPPVDSALALSGSWRPTTPAKGAMNLQLSSGQVVSDKLFGVKLL